MNSLKLELKNEFVKVYSFKLLTLVITCIVLFCFFNVFNNISRQYYENWKKELQEEIAFNNEFLEENRDIILDGEMYQMRIAHNERLQYYIDNDISPNTTVLRFLYNSIDLNLLLILLSILVSANVFCGENNFKTEKIYLARSIKRRTLIFSKLILAFLLNGLLYLVAILISFLLGVIFFSNNGFGIYEIVVDTNGIIKTQNFIFTILNSLVISGLLLLFLTLLTSLISVIIKKQLLVVLIIFLIWNISGSLAEMFNILPKNLECYFFPYVLNYFTSIASESISWSSSTTIGMSISLIVHSLLMFFLTVLIFIKCSTFGGKLTYNSSKIVLKNNK